MKASIFGSSSLQYQKQNSENSFASTHFNLISSNLKLLNFSHMIVYFTALKNPSTNESWFKGTVSVCFKSD